MSEPREDFEEIHEKLIVKYQEAHPSADWQEACEATAEAAYAAWTQSLGHAIDDATTFGNGDLDSN